MEPGLDLNLLSGQTIGAAIEVHRVLGPGLLESVYEEAMCIELALRGVAFARQLAIDVEYKRRRVGEARLDLVVEGKLIVELKSVESFAPVHYAQLLSYLNITSLRIGLLINFNVRELRLGIKRIVNSPPQNPKIPL